MTSALIVAFIDRGVLGCWLVAPAFAAHIGSIRKPREIAPSKLDEAADAL